MATKPSILDRRRLNWRMRLAARRRVTVVHGPAGCGKTIAVAHYLASSGTPNVTLHVRGEHGGVACFARALAQTLTPLAPSVLHLLPVAFSSSRRRAQPWDAVATWLAEQLPSSATIAIDQLHRLGDDESALRFLTRVIDASGPHVRWIIAARSTAALPLPRWLAAGLADASIDEDAWRLERSEIADLARHANADVSDAEQLHAQHDGHIGAILDALRETRHPWESVTGRGQDFAALAALASIDDELAAHLPPSVADLFAAAASAGGLDEESISLAHALAHAEGATAIARGRLLAAQTLERAGRHGAALLMYVAANADADIERIVHLHGFDLMERDGADIAAAAIAALPADARRRSALALMLEATDESFRGRYDVSESWFENAAALAVDDRQRRTVQIAFAIDLLRRGREDARERLASLAGSFDDPAHGVLILASLAVAHARNGDFAQAEAASHDALAELKHVTDVGIRATVHQRTAFVALAAGDVKRAARHADVAATLAAEHGNEELAAVARSVSHVVAYSYEDDHARSLDVLAQIERFAERLGNAFFRRFALIGAYLIYAERGARHDLAKIEALLSLEELEASLQHVEEALLPARALRATWSGDFSGAHQLLAFSLGRQSTAETRALRAAEISLYAAVADRRSDADEAFDEARRSYDETGESRSVESLRAALLAAVAAVVLERCDDALSLLAAAAPLVDRWPRWQPFHTLLASISGAGATPLEAEEILALLEAMHDNGLGGWAGLIAAIPHDRLASISACL